MTADDGGREERPRICVLGPVELHAEGTRRTVRGRVGRLLVALVAARRPTSLERLADVVWLGEPPATYRPALHVHLGSLRRTFAELGGGAEIERDGDTYSLRRGDWVVDAELAASLVDAASSNLHDPHVARRHVEDALELWRGTPFAVDGEVVDLTASVQADALRRTAEELLVETLLAVGDAPAAEEAASRLVDEEPTRERRWGQLLRARFLAGRTADALATYQAARTTLIELLGIEPGRELRGLEAAVLTEDLAALRIPPSGTPRALPPPRTDTVLVGREEELGRLADRVARAQAVVLLGAPGVGKTRLALELVGDRPDVAWVDVREPHHTAAMDDLSEWVRPHPKGVVVFDNAEMDTAQVARAASDLRQHAPGVAIVVTSRVPIPVDAAVEIIRPLPVPSELDDAVSVELSATAIALRNALAELAPDIAVSSEDIAALCRRTAGLPLAVRLVAAAARALPVSTLVARGVALEGDEVDEGVRSVLAVLPEHVRTAFVDLAAVDADFDAALAARVTNLSETVFDDALMQLVDHGLLVARPGATLPYSMLEPVREVASRLLRSTERRTATLDRVAAACIERAIELDRMAAAGEAGLAERLAIDVPRLSAALDHLVERGDHAAALELTCRLERPLYTVGWWTEKTELFDRALAVPGPSTTMRARAHCYRARPGPLHLFDEGHAERGEAMAEELGHELLLAYARHVRSVGLWWSGHLALAMELAADAARRFGAAGHLVEWSESQKFLGVATVFAGDVDGGLAVLHHALAVVRSHGGSPFHLAHHLAYLGHCQRMVGDDDAALADLVEASDLCRTVGNRGTAIHIEIALADLAVDRGDAHEALARVTAALDLIGDSGGWTYEPWAWTVAIRAHALAGDLDSALRCGRRAMVELPRVPTGESVRLARELAHVALVRGDAATAARLLAVARATNDVRELPFRPRSELARVEALERRVEGSPGASAEGAERPVTARRLSISEAAGPLLRG